MDVDAWFSEPRREKSYGFGREKGNKGNGEADDHRQMGVFPMRRLHRYDGHVRVYRFARCGIARNGELPIVADRKREGDQGLERTWVSKAGKKDIHERFTDSTKEGSGWRRGVVFFFFFLSLFSLSLKGARSYCWEA